MTDKPHVVSWRSHSGVMHQCERSSAHPGKPCRCPCGVVRFEQSSEPESPAP